MGFISTRLKRQFYSLGRSTLPRAEALVNTTHFIGRLYSIDLKLEAPMWNVHMKEPIDMTFGHLLPFGFGARQFWRNTQLHAVAMLHHIP